MQCAWTFLHRLATADDGQDLLEYGLLATLIAVIAVTAITTLGSQIQVVFWETIANNF